MLNDVAKEFISSKKKVIAIATAVHDKFTIGSNYFHFYGGRQGRNMVSKIIKKSLIQKDQNGVDRIKCMIRVLEYVGYSPSIGFKVIGFRLENIGLIRRDDKIAETDKDGLVAVLSKYSEMFMESRVDFMELRAFTSGGIDSSVLSSIVRHEHVLRRLRIISDLIVYFEKNNNHISLNEASSGELMVISTLIFISSVIDENTVILIDEPENSLHPKWQKEYISRILDLFHYYHPKIILATHSSLILPLQDEMAKLLSIKGGELHQLITQTSNNEEVLSEAFGIVTPENRYLSEHMIEIINDYGRNRISKVDCIM